MQHLVESGVILKGLKPNAKRVDAIWAVYHISTLTLKDARDLVDSLIGKKNPLATILPFRIMSATEKATKYNEILRKLEDNFEDFSIQLSEPEPYKPNEIQAKLIELHDLCQRHKRYELAGTLFGLFNKI